MLELRQRLQTEIGASVVGQQDVIDAFLIAVSVGGHVLLEGVPGTAKTLTARTFAAASGLDFNRIQFTPDMLPSDVTGTVTLRGGELAFNPGPIFGNVILGDEINRTPPKTQAAMLEAMQEGSVTVDGVTHNLGNPFIVLATQNPIEYEGTYPLPEAQLDRFLMKVTVDYPSETDEVALLNVVRDGIRDIAVHDVTPVTSAAEILEVRTMVAATTVREGVTEYVAQLVRQTRILPAVELGAGPRAGVHLLTAAKAVARLAGRDFVTPDDVADIGPNVLRHRIILRPEAELDRLGADDVIKAAFAAVPVPK